MWKVADPKARQYLGIGALNMIRRDVYRELGGYESLRMEVVEDLRLGFEVKRRGFRQHVATGTGLIRIRWAEGAAGVIANLTKNCFAIFRFRMSLLLLVCAAMAVGCIFPFVAFLAGPAFWLPGFVIVAMLLLVYRFYEPATGTRAAYALTFPIAAILTMYALLRSMALTLVRGGVDWRGTRYALR